MKSRGVTPIKNRLIDEKSVPRFLSPAPIIKIKHCLDTQKSGINNKFQLKNFSETNSPFKLEQSSKILNLIDKKIFRKRTEKKFQSQVVSKEDQAINKEKKLENLKKNRIHLQYLKKNLTKRNCSLSILDFWSNEMLINATKQVSKTKLIKKPKNPTPIITLPKKPLMKIVRSTKNMHPIPFNEYLEKINKDCDKTFSETQEIKINLARSLKYLYKSTN